MLEQLRFVQGSVAKKDYLPALTHFRIENGKVRGFNGTLALCSPIPFDIACTPEAIPLVQAIRNCTETIALSMTPAGRLSVKSGKFRVLINCIEGETSHVEPEGEPLQLDGAALLSALQAVQPFIGDDASRPWSNGVLLKGQSAFATNNVTLVEYWAGSDFPKTVNLPRAAIKEILRVGEAPVSAQSSEGSFTLHYSNGRWIRTALLATEWPDLSRVLDKTSRQETVNPQLFEGLEFIKPFVDKIGRVTFHEGAVCTSTTEGEGARFDIDGLDYPGSFQIEMLMLLQGVAQTIDFSTYPGPCLFTGERLRGAIIGMRQL